MGANAEACEARSDRETVRWTVSTLVQRCKAPAIKSTLFHHVVTSYISLVAIFFIFFLKIATALMPLLLLFPKKLTLFGDPDIYFYFCINKVDSDH